MNDRQIEAFLSLRRTFTATREQVFRAWTEPRAIEQWFKPQGRRSTVTALDLRVGGSYSIKLTDPDGGIMTISGTYREITRPDKLVFTWTSEMTDDVETLVTLEFIQRAGQTEVVLTHERFTTEQMRASHEFGWTYMLDEMGRVIQ